jgi:hypothetical protein
MQISFYNNKNQLSCEVYKGEKPYFAYVLIQKDEKPIESIVQYITTEVLSGPCNVDLKKKGRLFKPGCWRLKK